MKKLIFLSIGFLIGMPALAKELEVTADETKVYATANKTAAVIGNLTKGQSVECKDRIGMYWQVVMKDGHDGFVSFMTVKQKKENEGISLSKALREAVQNRRDEEDPANVRARSTVMGVRGLQDSKEVAFAGNARPNLRMVYNLESYSVNNRNIDEIALGVQEEIAAKLKAKGSEESKP